jgi:hypothetical protein
MQLSWRPAATAVTAAALQGIGLMTTSSSSSMSIAWLRTPLMALQTIIWCCCCTSSHARSRLSWLAGALLLLLLLLLPLLWLCGARFQKLPLSQSLPSLLLLLNGAM